MDKVVIIGGGIIGLSSAYFLQAKGCDVTVLDQGDFSDNCSYGNAGYVCPSHYIPLASPGKFRQGLKWMLNAQSPFYIHPSLNRDLIDWGLKFMRSATAEHTARSAVPLRDIALLSQQEYRNWSRLPEFDFNLEENGLLEIFRTPAAQEHCQEITRLGQELGLDVEILEKEQLQQLEPDIALNALGAIDMKPFAVERFNSIAS